jgi:hypothetical protein
LIFMAAWRQQDLADTGPHWPDTGGEDRQRMALQRGRRLLGWWRPADWTAIRTAAQRAD